MRQLCLGIDLGTTNSKAAFLDYRQENASPEPLKIHQYVDTNKEDDLDHLPSVVLFQTDGKTIYVGEHARRSSINFPDRSVRAIKRLMGKSWSYAVQNWNTPWTPQGISALILKKLYQQSLDDLKDTQDDLSSVTISVPASFGSRQRQATIEAARLAGFRGEVHLIDEPSAALIHYIYQQWEHGFEITRPMRFMVFDIGGGTLDVSLAQVKPDDSGLHLSILSRSRYTELAGIEFDLRLAAYLVLKLQKQGLKLPDEQRWMRRVYRTALFDMAEPVKQFMSRYLRQHMRWWGFSRSGKPFDFPNLDQEVGIDFIPRERQIELGAADFEVEDLWIPFLDFQHVLKPFFDRDQQDSAREESIGTIYGPIENALNEKNLTKNDIDVVLLHGGMSELPLIEVGLMGYFSDSTEVTRTPSSMTSVAQGAALYQASRNGYEMPIHLEEPALFESIFYEKNKGGFDLIVSKNCIAGDSGIHPLKIGIGRKFTLRLYHGFSERDPLLTHDQDLIIELKEMITQEQTIELQWRVNPNRTVAFEWRDPRLEEDWQSLRQASSSQHNEWYPSEIREAEAKMIQQSKVL